MNEDRLLRLADYLDTVPPDRFDMDYWGSEQSPASCSFSGCAGGWATNIFPELRLVRDGGRYNIKYGDLDGLDALEAFFELNDGAEIFDPEEYEDYGYSPTTKEVAARIRDIIS
jgi:hypothetical protein